MRGPESREAVNTSPEAATRARRFAKRRKIKKSSGTRVYDTVQQMQCLIHGAIEKASTQRHIDQTNRRFR